MSEGPSYAVRSFAAGLSYWELLHVEAYGSGILDRTWREPVFADRLQLNVGLGAVFQSGGLGDASKGNVGPRFENSHAFYAVMEKVWWLGVVARSFIDRSRDVWRYGGGMGLQVEFPMQGLPIRMLIGAMAGGDVSGRGDGHWLVEGYGGTTFFDFVTVRAGYDVVEGHGQAFATISVDLFSPLRGFHRASVPAPFSGEKYEYEFRNEPAVLSAAERAAILSQLDDPRADPSSEEYISAMRLWPEGEGLWSQLTNDGARLAFVRHVLRHDPLSVRPYVAAAKAAAQLVPEESSFMCKQFARTLYYRYRESDAVAVWGASPDRVHKAPPKYRMPIHEVHVQYVKDGAPDPVGHQVNGIFLDGDVKDPARWVLFEPQDDAILFSPAGGTWKDGEAIFTVIADHDLPIDAGDEDDTGSGPPVVRFSVAPGSATLTAL